MELIKLTERVMYYPFEKERDRPNLGYIRGDKLTIAIDAGHSREHIGEFYRAIENEGLPLPDITIITHWHWDHTFAMHAVHGITVANTLTSQHLKSFAKLIAEKGKEEFLSLHESIRLEYAGDKPVVITLPDMTFSGELMIDAGNCPVHLFQSPSPHTDDSTLICLPGEKILFIGDSAGGKFPTWEMDPVLSRKLAETINNTDADICLEGHCDPCEKQEIVTYLLGEVS